MNCIKKIFIPGITALVILISVSCHKYPEDDFISLKRPYARLTGVKYPSLGYIGIWRITSYKIGGVEHAHDFDTLLPQGTTLTDCTLLLWQGQKGQHWGAFSFRDKNGVDLIPIIPSSNPNRYSFQKKANILFSCPARDSLSRAVFYKGGEWKILELYRKKFHIYQNDVDIYFKKEN